MPTSHIFYDLSYLFFIKQSLFEYTATQFKGFSHPGEEGKVMKSA
jgi:hypothetical protein